IWVYTDVTDTHEQQAQLELAQMVFNHANEALMVTDADNVIRSVNMAFATVTGYSEAEALGRTPSMLKSGHHDQAFYRDMWTALLRDNRWEGEVMDRHKSGRLYPKWLSIRVVRAPDGRITNFVAAFNDISARKAAEEKIQHMAHHDALTGLPNRVLLRDRFDNTYRRARRDGHSVALYFLDLDHFKRVNDTLGHAVGDELLIAVTQRLQTCLRDADTISRLGGDEFIVLTECKGTPPEVGAVAERIMRALDEPMDIRGHPLSVSGSLGIAMAPQNGEDFDTLLKQADVAMYHAKAAGRGAYSFFDTRMNQDSGQHLLLASALRHAPERGELSLVYQPQFDLAGCRPTGAEALMRWNSPRHGQVSPAQFIPLAEETGMINAMGEWALYQACRQARAWHERGLDLKVAVNISGVQIYRDDFAATVTRVLQDTGIAPHRLELELTESTLMKDVHRFVELMAYLGAQGVTLAIDDFGTGYSSLSYLKRFRVAKLKVDKSFVRDIPDDKEDCAIAEAIVRMGQALNLKVTAEGVETGAQFDFLRGIGCDEAQGYLLSAPGRAEDVEPLLRGPHPLGAALRKESGAPPATNLRAPRAKSGHRARPAQA
ncbi:MAG: EAL domain-containing protein, partial [Rhodocyclaceae bacterium]|nr:EAL domain-containing protein [Rhodocyclaceae bacterium]